MHIFQDHCSQLCPAAQLRCVNFKMQILSQIGHSGKQMQWSCQKQHTANGTRITLLSFRWISTKYQHIVHIQYPRVLLTWNEIDRRVIVRICCQLRAQYVRCARAMKHERKDVYPNSIWFWYAMYSDQEFENQQMRNTNVLVLQVYIVFTNEIY